MTRTPPQHGERRCYLRGCRQPECEAANYRYMSALRLDHERGHHRRTDPTPAANHIRALLNRGWTQAQISRATGVTHRVLGNLLVGVYESTNCYVARRVLALDLGDPPVATDVDATGTIRRLRALISIGYSGTRLAAEVGMHRDALNRIVRGELNAVRATTADAVRQTYRQLSRIPGPSNQARALAARRGWHGPLAWDDIDDPTATPDGAGAEPTLSRNERAAILRDEVDHLARFGLSSGEIRSRLGGELALSTVQAILREIHTGQRRDRTSRQDAA